MFTSLPIAYFTVLTVLGGGWVILASIKAEQQNRKNAAKLPLPLYTQKWEAQVFSESAAAAAKWKASLNNFGLAAMPIAFAAYESAYPVLVCLLGFFTLLLALLPAFNDFPPYLTQMKENKTAPSAYRDLERAIRSIYLGGVKDVLPYFAGMLAIFVVLWWATHR